MKQLKWPISLFSLCAVESFQLRRAEFDENSENLNAFFSMFSNGMTYFEGYHVKADVLRIPKMWYFLRFRAFIPELSLPKVAWNIDKIFQKMSVSKKLTFFQKNLLYQNLLRGFFKPNLETSLGRNKQKQIFWANVSFFWRLIIFVTDRRFQSRVSLSSDNSGLKALNLKKYHIFGILRTSAFTWYPSK